MNAIDFGKTAADYRRHRAGFPEDYFARLAPYGVGVRGQRVLDLGTGTGTVARGLARRGCVVTAIDPASPLMAQARELDAEAGVHVDYREGTAEQTGLPDQSFDVVTAGQCWHWFKRDLAAAEASRVLRAGGTCVISHFDWLPLAGNVVEATEALIMRHNPAWKMAGGKGVHPAWFSDLAQAGFLGIESFSFDVDVIYNHDAWRGRIRASAGVAASLEQEAVCRFDEALAELLAKQFPSEPLAIPHRVFAVLGRKPSR
ncbi:SAM-dependent methyltransferase [Herbaspirillum sp. HC18]|nr:SAM-dependent methyltransferase [Herbaspirillum sp. HC18]